MADEHSETITLTGPGGNTTEIGNDFEIPTGQPRRGGSALTRVAAVVAAATAVIGLATGGRLPGGQEPVNIDPKPPAAPIQPFNR